MATERESLSGLVSRAERLSQISGKIDTYARSLGTDKGPQRLNYHLLSGTSRTDSMIQVGSMVKKITTIVLPNLERKQNTIAEQLESQVDVMLQRKFGVEEISQFVTDGFLPPDALELARQDMDQFKHDLERDYRRGLVTRRQLIFDMFGVLSEEPQAPVAGPSVVQPEPQAPAEISADERQAKALENIAAIQGGIDRGILVNQEAIIRAQEAALVVGGTIEFTKPAETAGSAETDTKLPEFSQEERAVLGGLVLSRNRIEEEIFELPNGKPFTIKAGRFVRDIFKLILNGHLEKAPVLLADLAVAIYGAEISDPESELDLDGAKRRISANITSLNRLLTQDKVGYFIKNLTAKGDSNKGFPSKFDLVEIAQVQTNELQEAKEALKEQIETPEVATPVEAEVETEVEAGVTDEQVVAEEVRHFREAPSAPRQRGIEVRDPEVRERISEILNQLEEKHITKPISSPQLTRFFPRVKAKFTTQIIERGYINPERGRDHRPAFKLKEVAVLIYIREYGTGLNSRQVTSLQELVNEEYAKRNAQNNK